MVSSGWVYNEVNVRVRVRLGWVSVRVRVGWDG